jgi:hypothetical protein
MDGWMDWHGQIFVGDDILIRRLAPTIASSFSIPHTHTPDPRNNKTLDPCTHHCLEHLNHHWTQSLVLLSDPSWPVIELSPPSDGERNLHADSALACDEREMEAEEEWSRVRWQGFVLGWGRGQCPVMPLGCATMTPSFEMGRKERQECQCARHHRLPWRS